MSRPTQRPSPIAITLSACLAVASGCGTGGPSPSDTDAGDRAIAVPPGARAVAVEGRLRSYIADYDDGSWDYVRVLETADGSRAVSADRQLVPDGFGLARGWDDGGELTIVELTQGNNDIAEYDGHAVQIPDTMHIAVVLANFTDDTSEPYTAAEAETQLFSASDGLAAYLDEVSGGTFSVTGDVFGWYNLPIATADCAYATIFRYVRWEMIQQGIDLALYDGFLVGTPTGGGTCTARGIASAGWPYEAWVKTNMGDSARVPIHEMVHTLGVNHSNSWSCATWPDTTDCTRSEYGHRADVMGGNGNTGHLVPRHKSRLGWLDVDGAPAILNVTASGSYTIDTYASASTGPKALRIAQSFDDVAGTVTTYYATSRQAVRFDTLADPDDLGGILVTSHEQDWGIGDGDLTLIELSADLRVLDVGESFTDATNGVTIAPTAIGTDDATISVTVDGPGAGCVEAAPTVAITPLQDVLAVGERAAFEVTITSNDSDCGDVDYQLSVDNLPASWDHRFVPDSALVRSGGNNRVVLEVTPDGADGIDTYGFDVVATDAADATHATTTALVYDIVCERAPPGFDLATTTATGKAGDTVTYDFTVTNNNSAGCGNSAVRNERHVETGWTIAEHPVTNNLAPGDSRTWSIEITSDASTPVGTYLAGFMIDFYEGEVSSHPVQDRTFFTVDYVVDVCTEAAPTVAITPASLSGEPGDEVAYTVTVTNNDSTLCAEQSFDLTANVPGGWAASFDSASISIAPGSSDATTMRVTSPATGNSAGDYTATATATGATSTLDGSDDATYSLVCARTAPAVAISPASQSGTPGSQQTYTVTVTNQDNSACASGSFALSLTPPSGWADEGFAASPLSIAPGASDATTFTLTPPDGTLAGTYTATVAATSTDSGTGQETADYEVTCARATPTVTITPSAQTGDVLVTRSYTVEVTNNDEAACGDGSFALATAAPSGWTASLADSSLTLSPAASSSTTVDVTPSASASAADHTVSVTASNSASGSGSGDATYTVPCAAAAPSLALSPASASGAAGDTVSYTAQVTNNDRAGCPSREFTLTATAPDVDWSASFATSPLTVPAGSSAGTSLSVTSPAGASAGNYTVQVSASNATSGSDNGSVTYTVEAVSSCSPSCTGNDVCCEAPNPCAGMCVPDCRITGMCPGGLTCGSSGVCVMPGSPDASVPDAAVPDASVPDAAVPDAGVPDAAVPDAAPVDAAPGSPDAAPGSPDAATGSPDAAPGSPDAATASPDAATASPDAGTDPVEPDSGCCSSGPAGDSPWLATFVLLLLYRRPRRRESDST